MVLSLLLAVASVPEPRTVNGQVLGTVEQFTTLGPAAVCMRDLRLAPVAGERVTLGYSGIHSGSIRLSTARGDANFALHEILAARKFRGELVEKARDRRIYLDLFEDQPALFVWMREPNGDDPKRWRVHAVVTGELVANQDFSLILARARLGDPRESSSCDRTYEFGWGVILGDEKLSEKRGE